MERKQQFHKYLTELTESHPWLQIWISGARQFLDSQSLLGSADHSRIKTRNYSYDKSKFCVMN